jgi:hypothetical protein
MCDFSIRLSAAAAGGQIKEPARRRLPGEDDNLLTGPAKLAVTFVFRTGLAALSGADRCEGYCPNSIPTRAVRVKFLSSAIRALSRAFILRDVSPIRLTMTGDCENSTNSLCPAP